MYAGLCDVQAQRRAAEKWKDKDETIRSLLFCALSALFKLECCSNASNSMDDIDLAGFCTYESLSGLDCKIQGFVLQYFLNVIFYVSYLAVLTRYGFTHCVCCSSTS